VTKPSPVLVISAFAPELEHLRQAMDRSGSPILASAVVAIPVGIGVVDAGLGTARAITKLRPRMILFVGTAGSYGDTPAIGSVAIARKVVLVSTAETLGEGYRPAPMVVEAMTDGDLMRALRRNAGLGARIANVATPMAITSSAKLGRRLAVSSRTTVENLELFAVARAAVTAGIPFGAVLGISNRVGPSAHAEWRRHQGRAAHAACRVVERFLELQAKGPGAPAAGIRAPSRSPSDRQPRVRRQG
jgi:nucleoside phosphorylase